MTMEQSFVFADHIDRHPFTSSQTQERALNAAIVQANISESMEHRVERHFSIASIRGGEAHRGKDVPAD